MFPDLPSSKFNNNSFVILTKSMAAFYEFRNSGAAKLLEDLYQLFFLMFASTWERISTTSTYSIFEYSTFSLHWRFNITIRLFSSILKVLVTKSSNWSLEKFSLNLYIFSPTSLSISDNLFCNVLLCSSSNKTIGISSTVLFNSLSSDSSEYRSMVMKIAS